METHSQSSRSPPATEPNADSPPVTEQPFVFTGLHFVNVLIHNGSIIGCAIAAWCLGHTLAAYCGMPHVESRVTQVILVALSIPVGWFVHQGMLFGICRLIIVVAMCVMWVMGLDELRRSRKQMKRQPLKDFWAKLSGEFTWFDFVGPFVRDASIAGCAVAAWWFGRVGADFLGEPSVEGFKRQLAFVFLSLPFGWIAAAILRCARYPGRRFWLLDYLDGADANDDE